MCMLIAREHACCLCKCLLTLFEMRWISCNTCKLGAECCSQRMCCFPATAAAALEGAEHIVMEGAKHVPLNNKPDVHWYGSGPYLEEWISYLHPAESAALSSNASMSTSSS